MTPFQKNGPQLTKKCLGLHGNPMWWEGESRGSRHWGGGLVWHDHPFKHLVLSRERFIHFKFLHRIYFAPAQFPANVDHAFWKCQLIQSFWSALIDCRAEFLTTPITMSVSVCLLGLVEAVVPSNTHRTFLNILLFCVYARPFFYTGRNLLLASAFLEGPSQLHDPILQSHIPLQGMWEEI